MIEAIYIRRSPSGPLEACERVDAVAGKGLRGDRHYGADDEPGQNVTLVEAEEIEAFCDRHGLPRDLALTARNLVTRGVRLDDLVGRTFQVGAVRLRGMSENFTSSNFSAMRCVPMPRKPPTSITTATALPL